MLGPNGSCRAHAGEVTVEGEGERIEDGGLARAGVAGHAEQTFGGQGVEVDDLGTGVGAETTDGEAFELH